MDPTTLPAVTPEELAAYKKAMPAIIHQTAARILKELDYNAVFGEKAEETVLSGITFTAQTFESIMAVTTPSIIDQQLAWGKEYFPGLGIPTQFILRGFEVISEEMEKLLPSSSYPGLTAWMQLIVAKQREVVNSS